VDQEYLKKTQMPPIPWFSSRMLAAALLLGMASAPLGCGTTRWSDTSRTATEQLLITDAMDRAISRVDLRAVAGKEVFLDSSPLGKTVDSDYLVSSLRQHMLASGCILKEKREEAEYVIELRAGAVGTDRRDMLVGVPATRVPDVVPVPGVPSNIPEIGLIKKTEQRAVAKIAMFAYNRKTGRPVWQSGIIPVESRAKDTWVLGAGPFQKGSIYKDTQFAGDRIEIPLIDPYLPKPERPWLAVAQEAYFSEPQVPPLEEIQLASHEEPAAETKPPAPDGKPETAAAEEPATPKPASPDEAAAPTAAEPQDTAKPDAADEAQETAKPAAATASAQQAPFPPVDPFEEPDPGGVGAGSDDSAGAHASAARTAIIPLDLPEMGAARPIPPPRHW
jgi:hypothetical protein